MQGRNDSYESYLSDTSDFRNYAKNVRTTSIRLWSQRNTGLRPAATWSVTKLAK
jgi:hypothetical protein